jgi:hypothetical protein
MTNEAQRNPNSPNEIRNGRRRHIAIGGALIRFQVATRKVEAPPLPGSHKVNFDGTSKGNPRNSCYVEVIRNNLGQIQRLTAENLGCDTNNSSKNLGTHQRSESGSRSKPHLSDP